MQPVTAPALVPLSGGLFGARNHGVWINPPDPLDPGGRWKAVGWTFERRPCSVTFTRDPCDSTTAKVPAEGAGLRSGQPYLVVAGRTCSTTGWKTADYQSEAERVLMAEMWPQIAFELWRGDRAKAMGAPTPYFADDAQTGWVDLVVANGGGVGDSFLPKDALAAMDDALASSFGGQGLIHVPVAVLGVLVGDGIVEYEGGVWYSPGRNVVVADAGYDGSGPDSLGNPAGDLGGTDGAWIYGTGPVVIRHDTETTLVPGRDRWQEALAPGTNDLTWFAERLATAWWDCGHFGARVRLAGS